MFKNIYRFFILFSSYLLVQSQDCYLSVPFDPLNTGLFSPWFVSTNPISQLNCSQLIEGSEVFVEATIFDIDNNNFFVYYPLVIDIDTIPAIQPEVFPLPTNNVIVIHVGINGDTVTLLPTIKYNISSIDTGNCINGLPNGSVFGQFAYCNGLNFFQTVNKNINMGLLSIPPILNSTFGDVCPTTRSFPIVDQDQSDNVLSQYIITQDLKVAQDSPLNRNILQVLKIISNGSDNRLLNIFINPAIGCQSFTASNLVNKNIKQSSVALNEIQANLTPITETTALVPPFSPFVIDDNNTQSVLKTNLYRDGVNQPNIIVIDNNDNINYCNQMGNLTPVFFIIHKDELLNMTSPDIDVGNNLMNFMASRFEKSWEILDCENLIGIPSPITAIIDPNTGIAISNNLIQQQTTVVPTTNCYQTQQQTTIPSFSSGQLFVYTSNEIMTTVSTSLSINLPTTFPSFICGNSATNVNCLEICASGLDLECTTPNFKCFNVDNNPINCNVFNFCGNSLNTLNCDNPCPLGFDFECKIQGDICFKDTTSMCIDKQTITTTSIPTINITTSSSNSNSTTSTLSPNNNTITSSSNNNTITSSSNNNTNTISPIANSSENISKIYIPQFLFFIFIYILL